MSSRLYSGLWQVIYHLVEADGSRSWEQTDPMPYEDCEWQCIAFGAEGTDSHGRRVEDAHIERALVFA